MDTDAPLLGKFCGQTFQPVTSTQQYLTLEFVTDMDTQLQGFRLLFNFTDVALPGITLTTPTPPHHYTRKHNRNTLY